MSKGLYDELKKYGESDIYPFHMPGHKRSLQSGALADFYQMDITEIDGFDNLHQPESMHRSGRQNYTIQRKLIFLLMEVQQGF